MTEKDMEAFLKKAAGGIQYPETPDLAGLYIFKGKTERFTRKPRYRRLAFAMGVIVLLLLSALSVPQVRAAVVSWLQLGGIGINLDTTSEPVPASTPLPSLRDLNGAMTLERAEKEAGFSLPISAILGRPDYVFSQNLGGPAIVALWTGADAVETSLVVLRSDGWITKSAPDQIDEIQIGDTQAYWLQGPHYLLLQTGPNYRRISLFIESNVLIWETGGLTYRLEGNFPINQALEIMKSLLP